MNLSKNYTLLNNNKSMNVYKVIYLISILSLLIIIFEFSTVLPCAIDSEDPSSSMPAIQPGQPILCTASDSLLWQHGRFSPCLRTLLRPCQGGNGAQDWSGQDEIFAALLAASLNLFYSLEEAQIANSFSREAICWDFSSILIFVALIIWRKNYKKYSHHFG